MQSEHVSRVLLSLSSRIGGSPTLWICYQYHITPDNVPMERPIGTATYVSLWCSMCEAVVTIPRRRYFQNSFGTGLFCVNENRSLYTWPCFAGARSGDPTLSISPIRQLLDFDADFDGNNAQLWHGPEQTACYASGCGRTQRDASTQ